MTESTRPPSKAARVKPGAVLRAAGAGGPAIMPNFSDESADLARKSTTPFSQEFEPAEHSRPRLTVERDGDRVARIIAYCRCGEKIVIDCDYAAQ